MTAWHDRRPGENTNLAKGMGQNMSFFGFGCGKLSGLIGGRDDAKAYSQATQGVQNKGSKGQSTKCLPEGGTRIVTLILQG
ncbi:hypothetical protein [Methylobacterium sp. V23]|uniref:hypothetical protein n=1 Tax=Methylobacterium sp. V23 TaxID=2044878 RepID=UPI0011B0A108|nr:hypothetical protein [Methylobacterium sp. V23]